MPFALAVISDIHYSQGCPIPQRQGELGAILLLRAVKRLNRLIKPDLVLVLGDCLDDPAAPEATEQLRELKAILDGLACPWMAIPGNHDPEPERFYQVMPRPEPVIDVGPVRLLAMVDPEEPGYNARRLPENLQRMRAARRDGFAGQVVAVQHVPVWPHDDPNVHYRYTNREEVLDAMRAGGVDLAISGHCHTPNCLLDHEAGAFLTVPALCETPFRFTLVTLDGQDIQTREEPLAMPEAYGLVDYHSHTQFAYCSENMSTDLSPRVAQAMGLRALALTEHSGQLYFNREDYWSGRFAQRTIRGADPAHSRMADYLETVLPLRSETLRVGLEVDADMQGDLVLRSADREQVQFILGAVHVLPESLKPDPDHATFVREFKTVTQRLCQTGIAILAHPFRIFRRKGLDVPPELYPWLAGVLKRHGVAAEINFHTNEPSPRFFQQCVERGVRLTFGGDAHNLYEVGEFAPHLRLLREIGVTGDPGPVMADAIEMVTR